MKLADVQFSDHERVVVARLTGEIDLSNAASIERAIAEATPNHVLALILDVSALDYLDSAGIHLIYKLREKLRARGQTLRLVIPPGAFLSPRPGCAASMPHWRDWTPWKAPRPCRKPAKPCGAATRTAAPISWPPARIFPKAIPR